MRRIVGLAIGFLLVVAALFPVLAQEEDERSALVAFVENRISSPTMQIRLNGLDGALSSDVTMESITIADPEGIWLRIDRPRMVWTRTALLTGRLEIDSLTAERIEYIRNPVEDRSLPSPEASGFSLPQLPVAIVLKQLSVPVIALDEPVLGFTAQASIEGSILLADGSLDADLVMRRSDGPGGSLVLDTAYEASTRRLSIDARLDEPAGGLVAAMLDLQDRPPVSLTIAGDGPVDDVSVDLSLSVAAERVLGGNLRLGPAEQGISAAFRLNGPLGRLLPPAQRAFFGEEIAVQADALFAGDGRIDITALSLDAGVISARGKAGLLADGFLQRLELDAGLANPQGAGIVQLPAESLTLDRADLEVRYDAGNADGWTAGLTIAGLDTGRAKFARTTLSANGTVSNPLDAQQRAIAFDVSGLAQGVEARDPALGEALGNRIDLDGSGFWSAGNPLTLRRLQLGGEGFFATLAGRIEQLEFNGRIEAQAQRLEVFSGLSGRQLAGSVMLQAQGDLSPVSGAFDLMLSGETRGLEIGDAQIDPLLVGRTVIEGAVSRGEQGLAFRRLSVTNPQVEARLDGSFASDSSSLEASVVVRDLAVALSQAQGELSLQASVTGESRPYRVRVEAGLAQGQLARRTVRDLVARFEGTVDQGRVQGEVSGAGSIGAETVILAGGLSLLDETARLENLVAQIGASRIEGQLARSPDTLLEGALSLSSRDIGALAALANIVASGGVEATITLQPEGNAQSADVTARLRRAVWADYAVETADLEARARNLFGQPKVNAQLNATNVTVPGVTIRSLEADVDNEGDVTRFAADASLDREEARLAARGQLTQRADQSLLRIERLSLASRLGDASLAEPLEAEIANGSIRIARAVIEAGGGRITLSGEAGDSLDLSVEASRLPLSLVNAMRPGLGLSGTIGGTARVTGAGSSPSVNFDLSGAGIGAAALSEAGVEALDLRAEGRYGDDRIVLEQARARNGQGVDLTASGQIPLSGDGLQLEVRGSAPLSTAEPLLVERGTRLTGTARLQVTATGSLPAPVLAGRIEIGNASLTDPLSNLRLQEIGLLAVLQGDRVVIERGSARLAAGGSARLSGSVGLNDDLRADLTVVVDRARYSDGATFSTTISGTLRVTGGLTADPLLSGNLGLTRTEIVVPENFGSTSRLLDVEHVNPPAAVRETLDRLETTEPPSGGDRQGGLLRVDVSVDAPNQIFVRGRGLDAELGGQVRVTGPITDVSPVGRFELRRGRLSILGQRIELTEGAITLSGDLDPVLDFTASTQTSEVTAYIRVAGRPSDPQVTFSSSPELPQDEVLAQIIFGRSIANLSALQIARLASAAAELAGGRNTSLVDGLRRGVGVDDLDIVEDSQGNAAVRAGKYVSDRVYLGVQTNGAETETTIDLDLTNDLKARGSLSSEGESGLGVFFEKDF